MTRQPSKAGDEPTGSPITTMEQCPHPGISHTQELIDNIPYIIMIGLGAAICWLAVSAAPWRWALTIFYVLYGVGGALWIMLFVCPFCHFYDTRLCPCGYGRIAARLSRKRDGDRFAQQFRKHIPVIVPLWFLPVIVGVVPLLRGFSWLMLGLLVAFAINSFVVLPLVSRLYGCAECPQKQTCPWMGGCKQAT